MTGLLFLHAGWASTKSESAIFKTIAKTPGKCSKVSMYSFEDYLISGGFVTPDLLNQFKSKIGHNKKTPFFFQWSEDRYAAKTLRIFKSGGYEVKLHMVFYDHATLSPALCHYEPEREIKTIEELCGFEKYMMFVWMSEVFFVKRMNVHLAFRVRMEDGTSDYAKQIAYNLTAAKQEWERYARKFFGFKIGTSDVNGLGNTITIPVVEDKDFSVTDWNKCIAVLDKISANMGQV